VQPGARRTNQHEEADFSAIMAGVAAAAAAASEPRYSSLTSTNHLQQQRDYIL